MHSPHIVFEQLPEPVRIVAKSDPLGVAAAAFLYAVLSCSEKRCAVRVVPYYTQNELDALLHEEYPSFVFLDCVEETYITRFAAKNAFFLSIDKAYHCACAFSPAASGFAYLLVIGAVARSLDHAESVAVSDTILQDALRSLKLSSPSPITIADVTPDFLLNLVVRTGEAPQKLIDAASMLHACARSGKGATAIASFLNHSLRPAVFSVWADYRREIDRALHWCTEKEEHIRRGRGVLIIHARDYVASYLTGSVAAHIALQKTTEKNTLIMVLAYASDGRVRVSLRSAGKKEGLSIVRVLGQIFESVEGEYGGTDDAAGGVFARSEEEQFVNRAQVVLEQAFAEEKV